MPAPTITPLPAAPLRSQNPATFAAQAETFVDALEDLPTEINAFSAYLDSLGLDPADIPSAAIDLTMATARLLGRTTAGSGDVEELTAAQVRAFLLSAATTWDFNFTDGAAAYIRANVAMTISEQATSGTGTIAYEKSTAAAPDTFSSTTSPVSLEAGAKLKVSASSITGSVAVHLERTA